MPEGGVGFLAAVAARTALVFLFLVIALRLTGRRQVGELNLHDLLLVLVMANAVQNAMTRGDGALAVALVSAATLLIMGVLFAYLESRHTSLERQLLGVPRVLVERGQIVKSHLREEGVREDELMAAVRDQGLADLSRVKLAVLEIDGSISVIPVDQGRDAT